jgi:hypothetical protein
MALPYGSQWEIGSKGFPAIQENFILALLLKETFLF